MKKGLTFCLAAGALALGAQQSRALTLTLHEAGFSDLVIADNAPGDNSPAVGSISFAGSFGTYFFQASSGATKPAIGSAGSPILTLNNTTVTAAAGSSPLTVTIDEPGFNPGTYDFSSRINGTVASQQVLFQAFADATTIANSVGGPGAFDSGAIGAVYSSGSPIDLKIVTTIIQPLEGVTLFDANVVGAARPVGTPDGGATAGLLGLGMLGVAAVRRKLS